MKDRIKAYVAFHEDSLIGVAYLVAWIISLGLLGAYALTWVPAALVLPIVLPVLAISFFTDALFLIVRIWEHRESKLEGLQ